MLITFSGVDCAGKSTQIELLQQYFVSMGKTCTVFWYRPGYSKEMQGLKDIVRPLWRCAASLKNAFRHSPKEGTEPQVSDAKSLENTPENTKCAVHPHVPAPLWLASAIMDTCAQWFLKLRLLQRQYDVVICDRYIEDAKLDLSFKYPGTPWADSIFAAAAKTFPHPDLSLFLWLPFDLVQARSAAKQEPFPDDEKTRELRFRAYEFLSNSAAMTRIDASGSVDEVHRAIVDVLPHKHKG